MRRMARVSSAAVRARFLLLVLLSFAAVAAFAQDNYEIQVYGSDTVKKGATMVELHSNYTFRGSKAIVNGVNPTQDALHETVEITHGWNDWFETGFYLFTSYRHDEGWDYVGSHIRPRVRVPDSWHWRVGASLSAELGFQRRDFAEDTWTAELRPIIDKQVGPWYFAFNPALDSSISGLNANRGWEFSPNVKVSYDVTKKVTLGVEYYGTLGPVSDFDPVNAQQHQLFPSLDLNVGEAWEINAGIGFGLTPGTDRFIAKFIFGRRL